MNYFYGVRPGLPSGGYAGPYGQNAFGMQGRQTFFPVIESLAEMNDVTPGGTIGQSGHPVGFNNYLGYYPMPGANGMATLGTPKAASSQSSQKPGAKAPTK